MSEEQFEMKYRPLTKEAKQFEYLLRAKVYLKNLSHVFTEMSKVWSEDSENDIDLNQWLSKKYPFLVSLDELEIDVRKWYEQFEYDLENWKETFIKDE